MSFEYRVVYEIGKAQRGVHQFGDAAAAKKFMRRIPGRSPQLQRVRRQWKSSEITWENA